MLDKINSSTKGSVRIMMKSIILCCIVILLSNPTVFSRSIIVECEQSIRAIATDPNQANVIYAAATHGIYKSTDYGSTWKLMNNGYPISIEALSINSEDSNLIYAAAKDKIYKSNNGGTTWQLVFTTDLINKHTSVRYIHAHLAYTYLNSMIIQNRKDVYALIGTNIYKSIDNGMNWTVFKQNCSAFAIDVKNPKVFYIGYFGYNYTYKGIYKSIDSGLTWDRILYTTATITSLNIDINNSQIIYAGNLGHGIFRSMDGGKQWHTLQDGLPQHEDILAFTINPMSSSIIYAGTIMDIYKSTDYGFKWYKSDKGLSTYRVNALAINFKYSSVIYAGTNVDGIFRSIDGGENWQPVNTGILCQGRALLPSK